MFQSDRVNQGKHRWRLELPVLAIWLFCDGLVALPAGCSRNDHKLPVLQVAPAPIDAKATVAGDDGPPPGTSELFVVPNEFAAQVKLERVAKGLARPVDFKVAPGDARKRWFIVLQHAGEIRAIENGVLADKPFFKIADISIGNEEGLLGLAFHPQFATNGRLFVNYTAKNMATHIVEYKLADADTVDPKSAREIIVIPQPYSNHNGGNLAFGPDGRLYTGMGDGGAANDPHENGQNPKALLGKLLSFDVDGGRPEPKIEAIGLRNPWRFSFDGNDLFIGDVGQNKWENVYAIHLGKSHNFGWNVVEGNHCFKDETCDRSGFTAPIADYPHDQGCSVTGGYVYRGKALPALVGRYFYADYCTGLLRSLRWVQNVVRDHWEWKPAIDKEANLAEVSSFGVDADGELYIVELTGAIYRLASSR